MIYSIGEGTVAYTSAHTENSCTPNNGGYGCVVVVHYPDQEVYALYAHLSQIQVNENEQVTTSSVIGVMGDTGCGKCGKHLHLGVLKPLITTTPLMKTTMTKKDWEHLVYQMKPNNSDETKYKSQCTYTAPNGLKFTFQDPTGWTGTSLDPWSLSSQEGGCGVSSPYLWKHQI
jgi:murein DD-endopeptidase MepM/ murein hydrolase activator NlpD